MGPPLQGTYHFLFFTDPKNETGSSDSSVTVETEPTATCSDKQDLQKEKDKPISKEQQEQEIRLAMEFPRHNWLVKHIMREKELKVSSSHCFYFISFL